MRLSEKYITTIRQKGKEVFGDQVQIYLFGSRTDDSLRGGDIDLYVVSPPEQATFQNKIKFGAALQMSLEFQKIDILLSRDPQSPMEQSALENGILLNEPV